MFSISKIQNSLLGLVGIRQPYKTEYQNLDSDNQASESGLFVDDISFFKYEYYVDISDTVDSAELNEQLKNIKKSCIVNLMHKIFRQKEPIDTQRLLTLPSSKKTTTSLQSGMYGYSIEQNKEQFRGVKISNVVLEFEGTGDITLILKNFQSNEIIESKVITITSNYQIENLEWYIDSEKYYKGMYFIGYISNDDLHPYTHTNYVQNQIESVNIVSSYELGRNDFDDIDINDMQNGFVFNGLNFDISIYEDYTKYIMDNRILFAKALQIEIACAVLNRVVSTSRSNINERLSKEIMSILISEVRGYESNGAFRKGLEHVLLDEISILANQVYRLNNDEPLIYRETLC